MAKTEFNSESYLKVNKLFNKSNERELIIARRTAFIARFIVLREKKKNTAHRDIEILVWREETTAEQIASRIKAIFKEKKKFTPSEKRDIERALSHANRSLSHFVAEYNQRATTSFFMALDDYHRSNSLLFGDEHGKRAAGWKKTDEIRKRIIELARLKQQAGS